MFRNFIHVWTLAIIGLAAFVFALTNVYTATADPDPHTPNMQTGYCPGGGAGTPIWFGYCDGVPFADGSYWHILQNGVPLIGAPNGLLSPGMQCVINDGSPLPPPAPAGGCGGAV